MPNEKLSDQIIEIAGDTETHLLQLKKIVDEKKTDDAANIEKKQKELESEITSLFGQINSESDLTYEAQVKLQSLKGTLEEIQSQQPEVDAMVEQQPEGKSEKILAWLNKRGMPATITAAAGGFLYGVTRSVEKAKGFFGKIGAFFKRIGRGIRNGIIAGGATFLGVEGTKMAINGFNAIKGGIDFLKNPAAAGRSFIKNIGSTIKNTAVKRWHQIGANISGNTKESHDPRQREIGQDKEDSDKTQEGYEGAKIYMSEGNMMTISLGGKIITLPMTTNMSALSPEVNSETLDTQYGEANFTDKTIMMNAVSGMRLQAAQKKIQSQGLFGDKGTKQSLVNNIEAKRFNLQKAIQANKPKSEISALGTEMIDAITHFEKQTQGVIGNDRENSLLPLFHGYVANTSSPEERKRHCEQTQLALYSTMRKTGGVTHGDSDVVKEQLLSDLLNTPKYAGLMNCFNDNTIMEGLYAGTISKETISKKISVAFAANTELKNAMNGTLANSLAQKILDTYNATKNQMPKQEQQMNQMLHRRYKDVHSSKSSQEKMIADYEQAYGPQLEIYAKEKGLNSETQKRDIVRGFARDLMKKSTLSTAVQSAFQDSFYNTFLPTQLDSKDVTTKEGLLSDVIGAGNGNLADSSINSAINIGIQVGLMCIPIGGSQLAFARLASRGIMVQLIGSAVVGHVLHTAVNSAISNRPEEFFSDLMNRREFGKNAVFYGVLGHLKSILSALNITGKIASTGIVSAEQLALIGKSNRGALALGTTEGLIVGTNSMIFDPEHQWHRKDVILTIMISTLLHSNLKDKIKDYKQKVTKGKNGKPEITLEKATQTLAKESKINLKTVAGKTFPDKMNTLALANNGQGTLFTLGGKEFTLKMNNGIAVFTNKAGTIVDITKDAALKKIAGQGLMHATTTVVNKGVAKAGQMKEGIVDVATKAGIQKDTFMQWCREHKIGNIERYTVGDFFKLIGEKKYSSLLFGKLGLDLSTIPTGVVSSAVFAGKNASTLFTYGSIIYGTTVGDEGGDAGRKEGFENYLLYGVIGRSIPGKLLLYTIDQTNTVI